MALTKNETKKLLFDTKKLLRDNKPKTLIELWLMQAMTFLIKSIERSK